MNPGTLYLIPTSLAGRPLVAIYPESVLEQLRKIDCFVVETPKIGRSFLKGLDLERQTSSLKFFQLDENTSVNIKEILDTLKQGSNVGVMSDAGYPGVGDMGTELVQKAHQNNIAVKTFAGPSAILQTLSASGLNGQSFTFNGYLPKEQVKRISKIRELERVSIERNTSQIFIEAPYRAQYIFEDILSTCKSNTLLSLGIEIETERELYRTMSIEAWRSEKIDLNKKQVVYILKG
ncbi:SAM-dependent methyltransferase [Candidatus Dojkabacteria bacterium]|nr:SAM-dependent methyltransferase [Candidatus Dojkabacteria bacterium]